MYMYMYIDMGRRPAPTILYSFCEPCGGKPLWVFLRIRHCQAHVITMSLSIITLIDDVACQSSHFLHVP